jgi:pimeloyl-ACP methyl ester carboxylesterase
VDAVMVDAGVRKAVIVGHSLGALIGRRYSLDYPDKAAGLVLADGPVWRSSKEDIAARRAKPSSYVESLRGPEYRKVAGASIDRMFVDETTPELRTEIKSKMLKTPSHVAASAMEEFRASDVWLQPKSPGPVLAIAAHHENQAGPEALLRERFQNLDYEEWNGVGHFLMMEQPERFNAAVLKFVQKIGFDARRLR